ncbi:hypothetical protein AK88_05368 [Plasmodium fragile]|uniref:Schizont-infected cell agglutination extracellular alpha domain-containing protein n=1 Tax=Plasmodium fragile TaxID=5857 RepID=A0A0D9QDA5_PLAFR|nr:uncharacterized protein AK88_05368 [Plasmodium fragile]KJP84998.1 hypothetical protein AK88_05368 [Plasmodium fragile]
MFDNMRRKLQSRDKVNKPQNKQKESQDITAASSCRRGLKKWTRCKMGRRAWSILIVVATVLYPVLPSLVQASAMALGVTAEPVVSVIAIYGSPMLCAIIYLCVLVCFCRSKTGKCVLRKIWKKKKKEEVSAEMEKNEGEVNKKPETRGNQKVPGKPEVPNKQEASGILEVPRKPEAPGKSDVPQNQETPKKPEVSNKTEVPGKTEVPKKPEVRAKAQAPEEPEVLVKPESCGKSEVPKKSEAPAKIKLPWKLKLPRKA